MKTSSLLIRRMRLHAAWLASSLALTVSAELREFEDFNYSSSVLAGMNGGTGWGANAWADADGDVPLSNDGVSLLFPTTGAFTSTGSRVAFQFSGEAERRLGTTMPLTTEGTAFYCSLLVKRQGDFRIEFMDNSNNVRWRFGANGLSGVASNAVAGISGDAVVQDIFPTDETVFIVAKLLTHASANDEAFLNIYRVGDVIPGNEPTTWQAAGNGASGVTLTRLQIRNISDASLEIDEIRVGSDWASVAGPILSGPPLISKQPVSVTNYQGADVRFSADTVGAQPMVYQWKKDGQPIAGATLAYLDLFNVQPSQSGNYTVHVSNSAGSIESASAYLSVIPITDISLALQALWHFDETAGLTAFDATDNNNDGNLGNFVGDDSQWVPSYYTRALQFSPNSYVEVLDSPSIGSSLVNRFSVAAWLRPTINISANGNTYRMLEKENMFFLLQGDGNANNLGNGGANLLVKKGGANLAVGIGTNLPANQWQHIVGTFDGGMLRIYLNGELRGSRAVAAPLDSTLLPLRIGSDYIASGAGVKYFPGAMDEVGIWSRALLPSEILELAGRSGPPVILEQPLSQTKYAGGTATFTVLARGADTLRYLWFFGTNEIRTATTPTLTLLNVQPDMAGEYHCEVSNGLGEVQSVGATLAVTAVTHISDALQVSYSFDETSGTTVSDASSHVYNGDLVDYGDPTSARIPGQSGNALSFDGFANRVVAPSSAALDTGTDATFSFWINPSSYGTLEVLANYNRNLGRILNKGSQFDIYMIDDPGSVRATIVANGANAPQYCLELNKWQHFVVLFQGGKVSFYKYGFLLGDPPNGSLGAITTNLFVLGNNGDQVVAGSRFFAGAMDEVRIWGRALTEIEIMTIAGQDISSAPVIVNQPQSATRYEGGSVSFTIDATGKRPLTYQWFRSGNPVSNSNTNRLALDPVSMADAGTYTVTVQNDLGSASTAAPATLVVLQITNVTTGLIGYWPMDETSGSVLNDASGRGHHAALQNTFATEGNPGVVGGCFNFDGLSAFAIVTHAPDLNAYDQVTFSFWASPRSLGTAAAGGLGRILRKDINYDASFYTPNNGIRLYTENKQVVDSPNNVATTNSWQHFTIVAKSGTIQFFKDGRSLGDPVPGRWGPPVTNDLIIANYGPDLSITRLYDGYMDELGIWDRALSPNEIDGIYQNGLLGRPLNAEFEPLQIQALGSPTLDQMSIRFFTPYTGRQHGIQFVSDLNTTEWTEQAATITSLGGGVMQAVFPKPVSTSAFFRVALLPPPPIFFEDFEGTATGWVHGGTGDNWQLGSPVNGPGKAYSGAKVYATSLTGTVEPYSDCYLRSPVINLTGLTRASLTFQEWRNLDPDPTFHGTVVNVLDANTFGLLQTLSVAAGGTSGYEMRSLSIPAPVLGRNVILEFRLYCDSFNLLEGWYIDDVAIIPE